MGTSTNGQLCYGRVFEEGYEFPWSEEDIETWWEKELGFKPSITIYNEDGGYINGVKPPQSQLDLYYKETRQFKLANPLPVELVNYCSGDCPEYILAIPSTIKTANRGYPVPLSPNLFLEPNEAKAFYKFCDKYNLKSSQEDGWYLSSYWG